MTILTDKTELKENPANGDFGHVIDVSDTSSNPAGTSKKVQMSNLAPIGRSGTTLSARTAGDDFDIGTGKFKAGSNTNISESSGDTLIENDSATNDIIEKLGDAAAATAKKIVDSADVVLQQVDSDGTNTLGKTAEAGVLEVKDASAVAQAKLNSIGAGYHVNDFIVGSKNAVGTLTVKGSIAEKVTTPAAATYAVLATDRFVSIDYTTTGTVAVTLPEISTIWNDTDKTGIAYTISDKDCNAGTNNITVNRSGADTIVSTTAGNTSFVIGTDGAVYHFIPIDSTTWKVY